MSHILTYTGRKFDPTDRDTWDFCLEDIAFALSNTCRFAGHVNFYSVAEHCIRVSDRIQAQGGTQEQAFLGLMHDAPEAYLGDIPRPFKDEVSIGDVPFSVLEDDVLEAILESFGLSWSDYEANYDLIKAADMAVYEEEAAARPNPSTSNASPRADAYMFRAMAKGLLSR